MWVRPVEKMNPYTNLPDNAFWKTAIATKNPFDIEDLWDPKFDIKPTDKLVTYGSCFAKHIGRSLLERSFTWHRTETSPRWLSEQAAGIYHYDVFSSRTGNIYTASLLKQWTDWALEESKPPHEVWQSEGRWYDPFRPRIEPNGFGSEEELWQSRRQTIHSFRESIITADCFIFTLGLTESWINVKGGYEYPMCPGTVAGEFSPARHKFVNQQFSEVLKNLNHAISKMHGVNQKLRFLLTVSPVPLTATKSNRHVLVATVESKSILRAVAGQLARNRPDIDYFPSFEIINSPIFRGIFFELNLRNIHPRGVAFVMDAFFHGLTRKYGAYPKSRPAGSGDKRNPISLPDTVDPHCDEALLEAFGPNQ